MSVILRTSRQISNAAHDRWVAIDYDSPPELDDARRVVGAMRMLERMYADALAEWIALAPSLAKEPNAGLAHTPTCAANISDFGQCLAWSKLVESFVKESQTYLVVCDDPWMFRHLASLQGVNSGRAPDLCWPSAWLTLRGFFARTAVAGRVLSASFRLRRHMRLFPVGVPVLLVYGHPASRPDGFDGYFRDLMSSVPRLSRMLHVDCGLARADALTGDGRTFSLHGWGRTLDAVRLPFLRWRGSGGGWLMHRARAREAGTGQAAIVEWQRICQRRWLNSCRPSVVAWPWENHAWERDFVRACRAQGVATLGYQHAPIGRYESNHSISSNEDGLASIPDVIVTIGEDGRQTLRDLGYPNERIKIGGALRQIAALNLSYDPEAVVFVALPFDGRIAHEMIEAVRTVRGEQRRFLIRAHPMTPFDFTPTDRLIRAEASLAEIGSVSAVLFAGTTVGLEARLAGLPTFRFVPASCLGNDVIPDGIDVIDVTAEDLADALDQARPPSPLDRETVFGNADLSLWSSLLGQSAPSRRHDSS